MDNKYTLSNVYTKLNQLGCKLLSKHDSINSKSTIAIEDNLGYRYYCKVDHAINGKKKPLTNPGNIYSIYNINRYLELHHVPFRCVSKEYVNATSDLEFECTRCGEHVNISWNKVNRNDVHNRSHILCPNCDGRTESMHALVLKQLFSYHYPDTIEEEPSCRNPKTDKILPTDIVNHRLKIAIEIQSQWHDFSDHKFIDEYKKNFWLGKGYSFYDPDIRDYSVLEMCQLFFDIDELPDYINYEYSNKLNIKKIQYLLDSGLSIPEIEKEVCVNRHRIYDAIYSGKLKYPENYQNACHSPIIQLDIFGKYVAEFPTIADAEKQYGFKHGAIGRVLSIGKHYSCNSYWYYKNDYDPETIKLESRFAHFHIPVNKYDLQGNYICSYDTVINAAKDCGSSNIRVYKTAIGEMAHTGGFIFKVA